MGTQSQEADGASGTKTDSNQLQIEYVRLSEQSHCLLSIGLMNT
jgi:hypothetical protein